MTNKTKRSADSPRNSFGQPSLLTAFFTYFGFYVMVLLGYLHDIFIARPITLEKNREGYPPLYEKFASLYSWHAYRRVRDCYDYPVSSVPGVQITLKERVTKDNGWTFEFTGRKLKCLNLASYNYLGFAESSGPCAEFAIESLHRYGVSTGATRQQYGTCALHVELERLIAEFLGVEDAIIFGMGFATNSLNIPTLLSPGCLVLSDQKNHASIVLGMRLSGATIKVFPHNDMEQLEKILYDQINNGQPNQPEGKYKPWRKILIVVEGIYSVDGTIVRLPELIELKKKYKAYLYMDEAHSIGAMGKDGRGICSYFGCDPKDVDILMGTFTKSFGSAGGYIAGSKTLITYLRQHSYAFKYACAMSPPVAAQIIAVLKILMRKDGTNLGRERIQTLARNTHYFRRRLAQMGVIMYGHQDSPVVPIIVCLYSRIAAFIRTMIQYNIATAGVVYPAAPLMECRIRICLSAGHTKEQLDYALEAIAKVVKQIGLNYCKTPKNIKPVEY